MRGVPSSVGRDGWKCLPPSNCGVWQRLRAVYPQSALSHLLLRVKLRVILHKPSRAAVDAQEVHRLVALQGQDSKCVQAEMVSLWCAARPPKRSFPWPAACCVLAQHSALAAGCKSCPPHLHLLQLPMAKFQSFGSSQLVTAIPARNRPKPTPTPTCASSSSRLASFLALFTNDRSLMPFTCARCSPAGGQRAQCGSLQARDQEEAERKRHGGWSDGNWEGSTKRGRRCVSTARRRPSWTKAARVQQCIQHPTRTVQLRQSSLEGLEARHCASHRRHRPGGKWRQWRQQCRAALQRCNRRYSDLSGLGAPSPPWQGLQRLRGGRARRLGSALRLAGWPHES